MISAWHLIWIIPCSMFAGAFCMALVSVNKHTYTKPDYLTMIADLQRQIDELKGVQK